MIRVAIIGRSHVGALKLGWDKVADQYPDHEVSCFASIGSARSKIRLIGKVYGYHNDTPAPDEIIFSHPEARRIDLAQFDHVIHAGYPTREEVLSTIFEDYDIDGAPQGGAPNRMSASAFSALIDILVERRMMNSKWFDWAQPRIWVNPKPYPDMRCLQGDDPDFEHWQQLCKDRALLDWARKEYTRRLHDTFVQRGITLLPHPAESIAACGLTDTHYSKGSFGIRRNRTHDERDFAHMNADYGALVMQDFIKRSLAPVGTPINETA